MFQTGNPSLQDKKVSGCLDWCKMSALKKSETFGEMKGQPESKSVSRRAGTEPRLEPAASCFPGISHTPSNTAGTGASCLELGPSLAFPGRGTSAEISSFSEIPFPPPGFSIIFALGEAS